ncbi:hypothetical protein EUTSA_v10022404mg, partial [Eutrema salsugineum]
MALSALPRHFKHHVFPSFHGEDVRRGLLSYLLKEFREKVIDVFIDNDIERSKPIGPELKEAIKGSMIAIVLISRNYASSTWCLDELVEIMKCREEFAQTVMVVFHEVEPSDVKKQNGYFGSVFAKTCEGKKPEAVERWKQALQEVAKIAGYHSLKFDSDSDMIETIATDVSDKLNDSTAANDSDSLVGIGTHTMKMNSLLSLKLDEVRMVGIWGPAGIGKTTIARALYRKLSSNFTHTAFIESIKGKFEQNYRDEHAFMLHLQEQLLSKTLNQKDLRIGHLGVAKARLKNKKVLVVLDDVDDLKQLEAMTDKACWFGPGSRIIITTKDNKILKAHEINHIYQVGFPSTSEALEILCLSAFRHKSPPSGFEDMALEVTRLAGNLPLGLRVFGAYLRGMSKDQWIHALPRLRTSLDGDIEKVLRFSYDALCDEDQDLFLHIACFFRGGCIRDVVEYLAESRFNVIHGLQVLVDKCFISIYGNGYFMIHNLLEQLGKDIVRRQSVFKPGKRQFLVDVRDIRNVLEENEPLPCLKKIDLSCSDNLKEIPDLSNAFNLEVLRASICSSLSEISSIGKATSLHELHLAGCINLMSIHSSIGNATNLKTLNVNLCHSLVELPSSIWSLKRLTKLQILGCVKLNHLGSQLQSFPDISANITEFDMTNTAIEEFPSSIMAFSCLRKLKTTFGESLKVFPDVPDSIQVLELHNTGIEEIPPSIQNLSRLTKLSMPHCKKLKILPTNVNLPSLSSLDLSSCTQLKTFPEISTSIEYLNLSDTAIEEVPSSIWSWFRLLELNLEDCNSLRIVLDSIGELDLSNTETDVPPLPLRINLKGCKNLVSLPHIPEFVTFIDAANCESLERIDGFFTNPERCLNFANCFKLSQEAKTLIEISDCKFALLPGEESPADFDRRTREVYITVDLDQRPLPLFFRFKACLLLLDVLYLEDDEVDHSTGAKVLSCDIWCVQNGFDIGHGSCKYQLPATLGFTEHMYYFESSISLDFRETDVSLGEVDFEFKITGQYWEIKE